MEITLLATLQTIINRYCAQKNISSMPYFAELAGIDRDTVSAIYHRPAPYCPTWGAVCAIAVACDVTTVQIKKDLRPLYTRAHAHSERQTAHRQRAIAIAEEKGEPATDRFRDIAKEQTSKLLAASLKK